MEGKTVVLDGCQERHDAIFVEGRWSKKRVLGCRQQSEYEGKRRAKIEKKRKLTHKSSGGAIRRLWSDEKVGRDLHEAENAELKRRLSR